MSIEKKISQDILDLISQEGYMLVKKPNNSKDIQDIFKVWNSAKISVQKRLDKVTQRVIQSVLKEYDVEEIKQAINNYAEILHSPEYRFTYKWRLTKFLKRGLDDFLPESDPLNRMPRADPSCDSGGITPPVLPVSPALREKFLEEKRKLKDGNES